MFHHVSNMYPKLRPLPMQQCLCEIAWRSQYPKCVYTTREFWGPHPKCCRLSGIESISASKKNGHRLRMTMEWSNLRFRFFAQVSASVFPVRLKTPPTCATSRSSTLWCCLLFWFILQRFVVQDLLWSLIHGMVCSFWFRQQAAVFNSACRGKQVFWRWGSMQI